jgi:hypothetical protein
LLHQPQKLLRQAPLKMELRPNSTPFLVATN